MKIGFVSSILADKSFEEVIDIAHELSYSCVELACWPKGEAERKYAGVSHIDVEEFDDNDAIYIKDYCSHRNVEISSLAFYPNTLGNDAKMRDKNVKHLYKVIDASAKLNVNMVTTFIGRNQFLNVEDNLKQVKEVWPSILKYAQEKDVKIAIENCPMLFDKNQWPGGQNLFNSPDIWERIFEILPNENFGINFDPSHFIWQRMDYVEPIYKYRDKIFHIHFKDIKIDEHKLQKCGILAYPLEYMTPKIPGLGDCRWDKFISALTDIEYNGYACVEVEDKSFEKDDLSIIKSLILSKKFLEQYVI